MTYGYLVRGLLHIFTTPAAHAVTTPSSVNATSVHGSACILYATVALSFSGTSPLSAGEEIKPPT